VKKLNPKFIKEMLGISGNVIGYAVLAFVLIALLGAYLLNNLSGYGTSYAGFGLFVFLTITILIAVLHIIQIIRTDDERDQIVSLGLTLTGIEEELDRIRQIVG
jgi:hypothetical protein